MQYVSNANWILYRIDIHGMKHIVKEYEDKPTYQELWDRFFNPAEYYFPKFRKHNINSINCLLDGNLTKMINKQFLLHNNKAKP